MKLSIIIPTLGRYKEIYELLNSILYSEMNFLYEVLIIDQNPKYYLDNIIEELKCKLPICRYCVDFKGLSKAKNYGAKKAKGDYLCFPDDDCKVYPKTFLNAITLLEEKKVDVISGRCIDETGADSVIKFKKEEYFLTNKSIDGGFVEATMVVKRCVFDEFLFDENMGVGAFYGAEEGYDWLYRVLTLSEYKAFYSPTIEYYHPSTILSKGDLASLQRVFKYRCGTGYLCRKHKFYLKYYKRIMICTLGCILFYFSNKKKYKYYKIEILALKIGWNFY